MVNVTALAYESHHVEVRVGLELGRPDQVFACVSLEDIAAHGDSDPLLVQLLLNFLIFFERVAGFRAELTDHSD